MKLRLTVCLLPIAFALLTGCGEANVDLTGAWAGTVTNGASNCPGNWTTGSTSDFTLTATQSGANFQAPTTGGTAIALLLFMGQSTISGSVSGSHTSGTLIGTVDMTEGACSYRWRVDMDGTAKASLWEGTIVWKPSPNAGSNCSAITSCSRSQTFRLLKR